MRTLDPRGVAAIAACIAAAMLAACTELKVLPAPPGPIEGIAYWLPKRVFVATVTYELRGCKALKDSVELHVAKSADVTSSLAPDETEHYYIPYKVLRNWWKDMNITVESQENGSLKGVTTIVTDRTGEAISQALTATVKLSSLTAARKQVPEDAVSGQAFEAALPPPECDEARLKDVATVLKLRGQASMSDAEKVQFATALAGITYKETVTWTPRKPATLVAASNPYTATLTVEPSVLVGEGPNMRWARMPNAQRPEGLRTEIQVVVFGTVTADPKERPEGFLVRQGYPATIRVCDGTCEPPSSYLDASVVVANDSNVFKSLSAVVPQFGDYVGLPFRNRPFETQTLTISLGAEGAVTKMGLVSNAAGVEALKSLNTNLDTLSAAKAARDKAAADAATAAQNAKQAHANQVAADNTAIVNCLKAQDAARQAGAVVTGTCQQ